MQAKSTISARKAYRRKANLGKKVVRTDANAEFLNLDDSIDDEEETSNNLGVDAAKSPPVISPRIMAQQPLGAIMKRPPPKAGHAPKKNSVVKKTVKKAAKNTAKKAVKKMVNKPKPQAIKSKKPEKSPTKERAKIVRPITALPKHMNHSTTITDFKASKLTTDDNALEASADLNKAFKPDLHNNEMADSAGKTPVKRPTLPPKPKINNLHQGRPLPKFVQRAQTPIQTSSEPEAKLSSREDDLNTLNEDNNNNTNENNFESLHSRINSAMATSDYQTAVSLINNAVELYPTHLEYYFHMSMCYYRLYQDAEQYEKESHLRESKRQMLVYIELTGSNNELKESDMPDQLEPAHQIYKKLDQEYLALISSGQPDILESDSDDYLLEDSSNAEEPIPDNISDIVEAMNQGNYSEAISRLDAMTRLEPDNLNYHMHLANCLYKHHLTLDDKPDQRNTLDECSKHLNTIIQIGDDQSQWNELVSQANQIISVVNDVIFSLDNENSSLRY